jgi:hypothetical protein
MFTMYCDPGHGWVKVPMQVLRELNIAGMITQYSYRKNDDAYLEEDMDLETFVMAYEAKHKCPPKIVTQHSNRSSRIRSYPLYTMR